MIPSLAADLNHRVPSLSRIRRRSCSSHRVVDHLCIFMRCHPAPITLSSAALRHAPGPPAPSRGALTDVRGMLAGCMAGSPATAGARPLRTGGAGHRRPGRATGRRLPRPPGSRPAQHGADPQLAPRRHPLAVRLRRTAPPRTRRRHPAGPGHPGQAPRAHTAHLAHRARGRRPAGRTRPGHVDRQARSRHARARRPDRAADLRADRPVPRRRRSRRRGARPLHGQGPQGAGHAAHRTHRCRPAGLAHREPGSGP